MNGIHRSRLPGLLSALGLAILLAGCGQRGVAPEQPGATEQQDADTEQPVVGQERDFSPDDAIIPNSIGMKLVLIPAGEFLMGSVDSDEDTDDAEKPQHRVRITKPFYLGAYEVTQGQYERVMGANPSTFEGTDRPAERVSWDDSQEFCRGLSDLPDEKAAGRVYRLPTEAEWEYACRAGTTTQYCFGDREELLGEYAWYDDSESITHPAGKKKPNAWGLFDMHGNVWEWCADWHAADYYEQSPVDDPHCSSGAPFRVIRGGSWLQDAEYCRSAARHGKIPLYRDVDVGFRVALVPPDQ